MIPELDEETGALPQGVHDATMDEIRTRYGTTGHRRALLDGLEQAIKDLKAAGCKKVYLDGSFITDKQRPRDFDACWEITGVDFGSLRPVIADMSDGRRKQKSVYKGELFPAEAQAHPDGTRFLDYFCSGRDGNAKGIIAISLEES